MSGWSNQYYSDCANSTAGCCYDGYSDNTTAGTSGAVFRYYYPPSVTYASTPPETEEQKQARLQQEAERQRQVAEQQRRIEEAENKAMALLEECIGSERFAELDSVGYIELDSHKHKGRKYRVSRDATRTIEVLDEDGKVIDKLCVIPTVSCPDYDRVLSKILLLQFSEEYILETANHFPVASRSL